MQVGWCFSDLVVGLDGALRTYGTVTDAKQQAALQAWMRHFQDYAVKAQYRSEALRYGTAPLRLPIEVRTVQSATLWHVADACIRGLSGHARPRFPESSTAHRQCGRHALRMAERAAGARERAAFMLAPCRLLPPDQVASSCFEQDMQPRAGC